MRTLSLLFFSACVKQVPPPQKIETCQDWDQAPEQGAFLQEDSTITLRSLVKTNSLCEEKLEFYRYTQRTESHSQGCEVIPPQAKSVLASSGLINGQYCVRLRHEKGLSHRSFSVYAGTPSNKEELVKSLAIPEDKVEEMLSGYLDPLVDEGKEWVQVKYPKQESVAKIVAQKVELEKKKSEPKPEFEVDSFENILSFHFCCGRKAFRDEPVKADNVRTQKWLKKVPRAVKKKKWKIVGYSSTAGADCSDNQRMSQIRSQAVASLMRRYGFTNVEVEWCGATPEKIPADEHPQWQRVDVFQPKEFVSMRVQRQNKEGEKISIADNTQLSIEGAAAKRCRLDVDPDREKRVDLAIIIDTSGSMRDDWINQIQPNLAPEIRKFVLEQRTANVDVHVQIYTLDANLCGELNAMENDEFFGCTSLKPGQLYSISPSCNTRDANESWGTGISWVSRYHPWRAGSFRAVLPISDELPCEGNYTSTYEEDVASLENAIKDAKQFGVSAYPFYGTLSGGKTHAMIPAFMERLAIDTKGVMGSLTSNGSDAISRVFKSIQKAAEDSQKAVLLSCALSDEKVELVVRSPDNSELRFSVPSLQKESTQSNRPSCKELPACEKTETYSGPSSKEPKLRCDE